MVTLPPAGKGFVLRTARLLNRQVPRIGRSVNFEATRSERCDYDLLQRFGQISQDEAFATKSAGKVRMIGVRGGQLHLIGTISIVSRYVYHAADITLIVTDQRILVGRFAPDLRGSAADMVFAALRGLRGCAEPDIRGMALCAATLMPSVRPCASGRLQAVGWLPLGSRS